MANNLIQIKRTSVSGRAANTTTLTNAGELALNMTDGIMYSTNGSVVFEIGANTTTSKVTNTLTVGGVTTANSTGITTTGIVTASGTVSGNELTSTFASADEGGQINLAKPPNATTSGGIVIDAYQDRLRIYENGGNFRGAYIDLTAAANGVGSNLLAGGGGGGGFSNGQSISVNNFVLTGSFTANGSTGSQSQFLLSSNTSAYWQSVTLLNLYYANGLLAFEATGTSVPGGGGATGGGGDQIFYENDIAVTGDYTITTNKNAMTAGPITINSNVVVTIPSGSVWTIV